MPGSPGGTGRPWGPRPGGRRSVSLCGDRLSCRPMEESTGAAVPQEALPLPRCHRARRSATRAVRVQLETPAPSPGPARPRRPGVSPDSGSAPPAAPSQVGSGCPHGPGPGVAPRAAAWTHPLPCSHAGRASVLDGRVRLLSCSCEFVSFALGSCFHPEPGPAARTPPLHVPPPWPPPLPSLSPTDLRRRPPAPCPLPRGP